MELNGFLPVIPMTVEMVTKAGLRARHQPTIHWLRLARPARWVALVYETISAAGSGEHREPNHITTPRLLRLMSMRTGSLRVIPACFAVCARPFATRATQTRILGTARKGQSAASNGVAALRRPLPNGHMLRTT